MGRRVRIIGGFFSFVRVDGYLMALRGEKKLLRRVAFSSCEEIVVMCSVFIYGTRAAERFDPIIYS
jgi:hypothetical protein